MSHDRLGPKLTSQSLGSVSSRAEKQVTHDSQNNALYSHNRVNHSYRRIKILNKEVKAKVDKNNSGSFIRYSFWKSLQKDNSTHDISSKNKIGKTTKVNLEVKQNDQIKKINFWIIKKSKFPIIINESEFHREKEQSSWHGITVPRFRAKNCKQSSQLGINPYVIQSQQNSIREFNHKEGKPSWHGITVPRSEAKNCKQNSQLGPESCVFPSQQGYVKEISSFTGTAALEMNKINLT